MAYFYKEYGAKPRQSIGLRHRFIIYSIIELCAANVLESNYAYEFERDFWFKDLSRYERRKLINKVFGVGFFDNLSLSLKLRILKY